MLNINLFGEEKTVLLGELIGEKISGPILIYLKGDLGAGKTHLSKGIAKGLGLEEEVTSPTFTLINEYDLSASSPEKESRKLYHLDLYRLDSVNQILDLGIEDFIDDEENIVIIEWAEKLKDYKLSNRLMEIEIYHKNDSRDFSIKSENSEINKVIEGIKDIANSWH